MPIFTIFRNGKKIGLKNFYYHFYILRDLSTNEISWKADDEEDTAEILIWIQTNYTVHFVRPDWQLIVDGVQLPKQAYQALSLSGKCVSFQYCEYEFVCHFPEYV